MAAIKSISIPQPCEQSWQQMTPDATGRFCQHCAKSVIDFTRMTDAEIISYLSSQNGKICGRIEPSQLYDLNNRLVAQNQTPTRWKGLLVAAGLTISSWWVNADAQTRQSVVQSPSSAQFESSPQILGKMVVPQNTSSRNITGTVINEKGEPISGVPVGFDLSNKLDVFTDSKGQFRAPVPGNARFISVNYVGYEKYELPISSDSYRIQLKKIETRETFTAREEILGGAIAVVKRLTFFQSMYYQLIKRPFNRIFHHQ